MIANPVVLLLSCYALANSYAFYLLISIGGFDAFGKFFPIGLLTASTAFFLQMVSMGGLFLLYRYFHLRSDLDSRFLGNRWGWLLLVATLAFSIFIQMTGAGRAGSGFKFEETSLLNYSFVLLQPDILYFLIGPYLRSSRLFYACTGIFIVSLLARGWMSAVLYLVIVFLVRYYPVRLTAKNSALLLVAFISVIALLPVLETFKWGMREGQQVNELLVRSFESGYLERLAASFDMLVSRFQNLNYVAYIMQQRDAFDLALSGGEVGWFYQSGIFNSVYCKFVECGKSIGIYAAEFVSGEKDISWNIDVGISGWLVVAGWFAPAFLLFIMAMQVVGYRTQRALVGKRGVLTFAALGLVYLFHGWLSPFVNLVLYGLAFYYARKVRLGVVRASAVQPSALH